MNIYYFDQITKTDNFLGGKGFTLGLMKNAGFPIPDGLILTEMPDSEKEWNEILSWWKKQSSHKLAIRSSAVGEDSNEQSFAGQNSSYLNIKNENEIKTSIKNCFQSMYKKSSALYREHFLKEKSDLVKMNVVLQVMVNPKLSGVFFSVDPRNNESGWIIEAIEGLGEDLVSGKKTPWHFEEKKQAKTSLFNIEELAKTGMAIRDFFGHEIDIEWAIDQDDQLKILQARPITALSGKSEEKRIIEEELSRLKTTYPSNTLWDGGNFKNTFSDIANNSHIKSQVEEFCTKNLSNFKLLEIEGYQMSPYDSIRINMSYISNDGLNGLEVLTFYESGAIRFSN